jgi:hypothetical protein
MSIVVSKLTLILPAHPLHVNWRKLVHPRAMLDMPIVKNVCFEIAFAVGDRTLPQEPCDHPWMFAPVALKMRPQRADNGISNLRPALPPPSHYARAPAPFLRRLSLMQASSFVSRGCVRFS